MEASMLGQHLLEPNPSKHFKYVKYDGLCNHVSNYVRLVLAVHRFSNHQRDLNLGFKQMQM